MSQISVELKQNIQEGRGSEYIRARVNTNSGENTASSDESDPDDFWEHIYNLSSNTSNHSVKQYKIIIE